MVSSSSPLLPSSPDLFQRQVDCLFRSGPIFPRKIPRPIYRWALAKRSRPTNVPGGRHGNRQNIKPCTDAETNPYQGPSWSWASINRPITWQLWSTNDVTSVKPDHVLVTIMNVNLDLVGHEPSGQLRYAKLQLRCAPLINGTLIERFVVHLFESRVSDRDLAVLRATGLIRYDQDDKLMA
jgi:hypothetical protein